MWRQTVVQKWISNSKVTTYLSNSDKSGDSKTFVATIVANVATESMWFDITDLMDSRLSEKFQLINAVLEQKLVLHSTD